MLNGNVPLMPAFEQNNVPVVLAANDLYAPYVGVFIRSLLDHAGENHNYDIIVLTRDISEENQRLLKSLAAGLANVSIRFYDPSPLFASFHYADEGHFWPVEVFYKITAPHILNYSGQIIVADVDMLLKTDIARLMEEDLGGCCVGGVSKAPDIYAKCLLNRTLLRSTKNIRARDYWLNIYGLEDYNDPESYKTFLNAGVLLFDCDKYLREVDMETILNTARQSDHLYPEECVLHILMKTKTKLLDAAWNVAVAVNTNRAKEIDASSKIYNEIYNDGKAFQRAYETPYMLHWAARPKPWVCPDVPYGGEWWQTAMRTPFMGHIIARMLDELEKRRQHYRERYGNGNVDVWAPTPKGIDRTKE